MSDDFGATWRDLAQTGKTPLDPLVTTSDPARLYGSGPGALATTADGGRTWSAHGAPLDHRGPDLTLATRSLRLQRVNGGRQRSRVVVPLRLPADERGRVVGLMELRARIGARVHTLGLASFEAVQRRDLAVVVRVDRATAARLRRIGQLDAKLVLDAYDDLGDETVRVLSVTIEA